MCPVFRIRWLTESLLNPSLRLQEYARFEYSSPKEWNESRSLETVKTVDGCLHARTEASLPPSFLWNDPQGWGSLPQLPTFLNCEKQRKSNIHVMLSRLSHQEVWLWLHQAHPGFWSVTHTRPRVSSGALHPFWLSTCCCAPHTVIPLKHREQMRKCRFGRDRRLEQASSLCGGPHPGGVGRPSLHLEPDSP